MFYYHSLIIQQNWLDSYTNYSDSMKELSSELNAQAEAILHTGTRFYYTETSFIDKNFFVGPHWSAVHFSLVLAPPSVIARLNIDIRCHFQWGRASTTKYRASTRDNGFIRSRLVLGILFWHSLKCSSFSPALSSVLTRLKIGSCCHFYWGGAITTKSRARTRDQ